MLLNLKTEMDRNGYTVDMLATVLDIHRNSVSNKLNGKSQMFFDEALLLQEKLFPYADLQYLFRSIPNDARDPNQGDDKQAS